MEEVTRTIKKAREWREESERGLIDGAECNLFGKPLPKFHTALVHNLMNERSARHRCSLLGVPAEIRNRIFSFALVEDTAIEISATSPGPPALLSVCKQIRDETITVYYTMNNNFALILHDYDIVPVSGPYRLRERYFAPPESWDDGNTDHGSMTIHLSGQPVWKHMLEWCEEIHHGHFFSMPVRPSQTHPDLIAISTLHAAVKKMRDGPWETVKDVLEELRTFMSMVDPRWTN